MADNQARVFLTYNSLKLKEITTFMIVHNFISLIICQTQK